MAAFRQGLAAEALAYALDRSRSGFASRALFSAAFATHDRDETWSRLALRFT